MTDRLYVHPEPVPPASQLAVLPFVAAIDGYFRESGDVPGLRLTIHRAMSREGDYFLQQACAYLQEGGGDWRGKVGRTFAVDTGIIGAAYGTGQIWRTKHFPDMEILRTALREEEKTRDPDTVAAAYLGIPFLGPQEQVVLVLYAECNKLNFFADDERIRRVVAMGRGFCKLFDWLQKDPFLNLRNFPLQKGTPVTGVGGLYSVQEPVPSIAPPAFMEVPSFNYEAAAA
jgi:hypothetical protein